MIDNYLLSVFDCMYVFNYVIIYFVENGRECIIEIL